MSATTTGTTQKLSEGRTEALQALFSSLSPEDAQNGAPMSQDQISKISDKLGEILGDAGGEGTGESESKVQRNERGELLNEEGLPIIEISEPVPQIEQTAVPDAPPPEGPGLTPLSQMSSEMRAFTRRRMNEILDLLEEEEALEEVQSEEVERERARAELERRKANARKELERLHAAKAMQKKMGKALLRNLADTREREEREKRMQLQEDMDREEERKTGKPKKSVAFVDIPPEASSPVASSPVASSPVASSPVASSPVASSPVASSPVASSSKLRSPGVPASATAGKFRPSDVGQPMKFQIVERFPSNPPLTSPSVFSPPEGDSDDESNPGSPVPADSDDGESILSDHDPFPELRPDADDEDAEDDNLDDPVEEDEFDLDTAQHHREIALAYYEKRGTLGQDAARAMAAHSHEPLENEWDQPEVPLEATLSHPAPKPPTSKFKVSRLAQAYNTTVPFSTPSTSLGASVLPGTAPTLKSAVRLGWLEDDKLTGAGESDGEDEDENVEAFVAALRRGEVTNAGAEQNADALVTALTLAYGGPEPSDPSSTEQRQPTSSAQPAPAPVQPPSEPKISKFKLARAPVRGSPSRTEGSGPTTPLSTAERSSPKLPTGQTVVESKPASSSLAARPPIQPTVRKSSPLSTVESESPASATSSSSSIAVNSPSATADSPFRSSTIVESPSFRPPVVVDSPSFQRPASQMPSMIVDSPSFQPPSSSSRPSKPPVIMSSAVRESTGPRSVQVSSGPDAGPKKVSRFMAQRS